MAKKIDKALRYWVMSSSGKVVATFKTKAAAEKKLYDSILSVNAASPARIYDRLAGRYYYY